MSATDRTDFSPSVGRSEEEWIFDDTDAKSVGILTYPAASLDQKQATLSVRDTVGSAPVLLPAASWRYVDAKRIEIDRAAGFDGGAIYSFTYDASDPMVMGLGLAAVRDVVEFLRSNRVAPAAGVCEQLNNPVPQAPTVRVLLPQLIEWARSGKAPAPSRYPRVADGTLVEPNQNAVGFPDLTSIGVRFPTVINELVVVDPTVVPPRPVPEKRYKLFVPRTDADGLDVAGVRRPDLEAPLATYTGWGIRKTGFAPGQLCNINGIYVPFAPNAAQRSVERDPRPSIAERYASRDAYVERVRQAAGKLQAEGLLLPEDAER